VSELAHSPSATARRAPTPATFVAAARKLGPILGLAVAPVVLLVAGIATAAAGRFAFDFRQFWQGGRDVVDGVSPYPSPASVDAVNNLQALGPEAIQEVFRFPYPAPVAVALAPLGALPFEVAAGVLTTLLVGALALTLAVLGVRDWRCYGAAFASAAVLTAITLATLTPLLALGLAVAWRYRDRRGIAAPTVAAVVVAKLFLWPVLVWLLVTRRIGTTVAAGAWAVALTLAGWAVIGWDGFGDYPRLVSLLAEAVQEQGYSLVALASQLGLPIAAGRAALLALTAATLVGMLVLAGRADGDRRVFSLAVSVGMLLSPIVWLHYFALLLVPIALARPRMAALWLAPVVLWATPFQENEGDAWRIVVALTIVAVVAVATVARARPAAGSPEPQPALSRA
jgi:alpha-1,2-mannosyltransferase